MPEKKTATPKGFTAKPQPPAEAEVVSDDGEAIAQLKSELAAQASQIELLQTKLYQAEAAARHLADLNQTLMEENEGLKKGAAAAAAPSQTAAIVSKPRAAASLMHPVFPNGALPSGMGDQELGWFD
jgi:chromosome segregation ATPase